MKKQRIKSKKRMNALLLLTPFLLAAESIKANELNSNSCQCLFKSKHYDWKTSDTPIGEQVELYKFKYHGLINVETSSRFRCVYECNSQSGNKENIEYVHYEIHDGYLTGGIAVAKLFNCPNSIPGFIRHLDYYEPLPAIPFSPIKSNMNSLITWAKKNECQK